MRTAWIAAALMAAGGVASAWGGEEPPVPASGTGVTIEDAAGRPVEGASVLVLTIGGFDSTSNWIANPSPLVTDANGRVALRPTQMAASCLFAWKGDDAGFHCRFGIGPDAAQNRFPLTAGKRVVAKLTGLEGEALTKARARIAIAGAEEWHFVDATIAADGTLTFPPMPPDALRHAETHIEARAPGFVAAHVAVSAASVGKTIEVRLVAARRVRGKVQASDAVIEAVVRTNDYWHGPQAAVAADGSFAFDSLSPETRRLYVTSRSHAPRIIDLPDGSADVDLGAVALERGRAVSGKILAVSGMKGGEITVGLMDDRGVGVVWLDTDVRSVFAFPHVGAGIDHVAARVGGVGGDLWIFERGKLEGELAAPPFVIRFEDDKGARAVVASARITWSDGKREDSIPVRMFSFTLGVSAVRLRLPGPGSLRVEIEGAKPVTIDRVDVDAEGVGTAKVVVGK